MPNAPKRYYENGNPNRPIGDRPAKPGTPAHYHPLGTYYWRGQAVQIIGHEPARRGQAARFRLEHHGWVPCVDVTKQPHPPRGRPPYTKRGYSASRDRNRTTKQRDAALGLRAFLTGKL